MSDNKHIQSITESLSTGKDFESLREDILSSDVSSNRGEVLESLYAWQEAGAYKSNIVFDSKAAFSKFKSGNIDTGSTTSLRLVHRRKRFVQLGVAASIALLVLSTLLLKNSSTDLINTSDSPKAYELVDGSTIYLMPEANVSLDNGFGDSNRSVELNEGQAYFEVSKSDRKFVVDLGSSSVNVIGTEFSVAKSNNELIIDLYDGEIEYIADENYTLSPNQRLSHNVKSNQISINTSIDKSLTKYIDGQLVFDNTPLPIVFERIAHYFDVEIVNNLDDEVLGHFTSTHLDGQSLNQIFKTLEASFAIQVDKVDSLNYTVSTKK